MTDTELVNAVMAKFALAHFSDLEALAGHCSRTVSKAKNNAQPLTPAGRAKLHYLLGSPWAETAIRRLFPKEVQWLETTKVRNKKPSRTTRV